VPTDQSLLECEIMSWRKLFDFRATLHQRLVLRSKPNGAGAIFAPIKWLNPNGITGRQDFRAINHDKSKNAVELVDKGVALLFVEMDDNFRIRGRSSGHRSREF